MALNLKGLIVWTIQVKLGLNDKKKDKLVFIALATFLASALFIPIISSIAHAGDDIILGRAMFNRMWTSSPASTLTADGLGPLYNARACVVCHKDGRKGTIKRGKYPRLLFRLTSDPIYGNQFQPIAVTGLLGEGVIDVTYSELMHTLADGSVVSLRKPNYKVSLLNYGDMIDAGAISPRSAPSVRGVGALQSISDSDILAKNDPDDSDNNGISGRVNMVLNLENGQKQIGRFGWKAIQPTVRQQNAGAAMGDLGISTLLFPKGSGECTENELECLALPSGNSPQYENLELPSDLENLMLKYVLSLNPDTPKNKTDVSRGAKVFNTVGCNECHTPSYTISKNKIIYPYTDLLLHDMGARLSDSVQEGDALGYEWKTPALWGNGKKVRKSKSYFLHDGRARNILEAILWHGGEADKSRKAFESLPEKRRNYLLEFVESL